LISNRADVTPIPPFAGSAKQFSYGARQRSEISTRTAEILKPPQPPLFNIFPLHSNDIQQMN
jgi:hypothetical protein